MANRRITVDREAYKRLVARKRADESFSDVIKRCIKPELDVARWLRTVRTNALSRRAVAAIQKQLKPRRRPSRTKR